MSLILPQQPVYVVSKGRAYNPLTAKFLARDGVPFKIVVEPQEADEYAKHPAIGPERVLVLPFSNLGLGSIPARNWIWEHAAGTGAERHWILDDNIRSLRRMHRKLRIPVESGIGFRVLEDFVGRYENVGIAGLAYQMFVVPHQPVFFLNVHVYSCILIRNDLPFRWRGRYNEDTDLCLQALAQGHCTVLLNAFMADKVTTLKMKGGNMEKLYQGDGRLKMARALEQAWPGVVRVERRYGRPQHVVDWTRFKGTGLIKKPNYDELVANAPDYGLHLAQVGKQVESPVLQGLLGELGKPK